MTPPKPLTLKGINYDVGTNYMPGYLSREIWHHELVEREIRVIRQELHCNTINIYGSDLGRLVECSTIALKNGLHVWLQPRLIDSSPEEMLAHLSALATAAEDLRSQYANVTLNLGCELSIFMSGLIPGRSFLQRATWLGRFWWLWMLLPRFNKRLNDHLNKALMIARTHFNGQISYGSGIWESVRWNDFDLVGLNYYREASNQSTYISELRRFQRYGKPIVITEFGCCSFDGADKLGGSGDSIVNYTTPTPTLRRLVSRNEAVQADYIVDLLNIYQAEGIYGAFVFEFIEPSHPYSSDPHLDLDVASYGIVKVYSNSLDKPVSDVEWKPKQAFHALAKFYGAR